MGWFLLTETSQVPHTAHGQIYKHSNWYRIENPLWAKYRQWAWPLTHMSQLHLVLYTKFSPLLSLDRLSRQPVLVTNINHHFIPIVMSLERCTFRNRYILFSNFQSNALFYQFSKLALPLQNKQHLRLIGKDVNWYEKYIQNILMHYYCRW